MQCRACRYYEPFITDGPVEELKGICRYPVASLPLSMAGYANRERETVPALADTCPVPAAPATPMPSERTTFHPVS